MRRYDAILFLDGVYLAPLQWDPTHLTFKGMGEGNLDLLCVMCKTHPPLNK